MFEHTIMVGNMHFEEKPKTTSDAKCLSVPPISAKLCLFLVSVLNSGVPHFSKCLILFFFRIPQIRSDYVSRWHFCPQIPSLVCFLTLMCINHQLSMFIYAGVRRRKAHRHYWGLCRRCYISSSDYLKGVKKCVG